MQVTMTNVKNLLTNELVNYMNIKQHYTEKADVLTLSVSMVPLEVAECSFCSYGNQGQENKKDKMVKILLAI